MSAKAFVLVNAEPGVVSEIVSRLREAAHIRSAYMVTGPYDAIAEVEAEDYARIAEIVEEEVRKMEGIEKTMAAFSITLSRSDQAAPRPPRTRSVGTFTPSKITS